MLNFISVQLVKIKRRFLPTQIHGSPRDHGPCLAGHPEAAASVPRAAFQAGLAPVPPELGAVTGHTSESSLPRSAEGGGGGPWGGLLMPVASPRLHPACFHPRRKRRKRWGRGTGLASSEAGASVGRLLSSSTPTQHSTPSEMLTQWLPLACAPAIPVATPFC